MKERRTVGKVLIMLALLTAVPAVLFADLGPKPSVHIDLEGLDGEECWGTLLSSTESTGPASAWDGIDEHAYYEEDEYDIWKAMTEYEDEDGFHFLQWIWDTEEEQGFTWGYYPPERFKVLLYFPESDSFRVSDILERYAFDSYFSLDVDGMKAGRNYDWGAEVLSLLLRILITIGIELLIAWMFGYREKSQMEFLAVVNIISQIMLNVALSLINYSWGAWVFFWWYIMMEVLVFALEAVIYAFWLERWSTMEIHKGKAVLYAFIANLISFAAGFGIFQLIPGIF